MSYLSMMEARLPPGFRFHPRDEELVCDYLAKKISGDSSGGLYGYPTLVDVDLNKCEPWDLPETACVGGKEWYFFSVRDRKYATGQRTNRATVSGYWKATGKDREVRRKGLVVGMRKTLVFYQGRAPKGRKTDWVMHEFRLEASMTMKMEPPPPSNFSSSSGCNHHHQLTEDWVLCRVFYKSRSGLSPSPKPSMYQNSTTTTHYDDHRINISSSSSLLIPPPLMETTYINFGNTAPVSLSLEGYHEQVPCFSNPFPSSAAAGASAPAKHGIPHVGGSLPGLDQLNQLECDKKVIRAVLSHLTKLEGSQSQSQKGDPPATSSSSMQPGDDHHQMQGSSIDSYLSDHNGLVSHMW